MNDLLIYIRSLLLADATFVAALTAAGLSDPEGAAGAIIDPDQRIGASYPRIVLDGEEGSQIETGDNSRARYFNGRVRLEIVTRESSTACPDPLAAMESLRARMDDLLLGNPRTGLPGVKGQHVSDSWSVTRWTQTTPTKRLPVTDPTFVRHLTTYSVQLLRHF